MRLDELSDQSAILALWFVVNASLSSYYKLTQSFGSAKSALNAPIYEWQNLGIHKSHIERLQSTDTLQSFLIAVGDDLQNQRYQTIFVNDERYPTLLKQLYDPSPVLFVKGNVTRLNAPQIAIVGSRKPTMHAESVSYDLAQYLVQCGYAVTSGLAEGVDRQAHLGALAQYEERFFGQTIGVMGTGINVCYPKSNQGLFEDIIQAGGCLVTELLPNTPASKFSFPRRNRLIAGLSLATVVTEAAMQSGSLITARLTAEQGKQVFAVPSRIDNPNAEGCHHLIREGATLIYHPKQIIEELRAEGSILPMTFSQKASIYDTDTEISHHHSHAPQAKTPKSNTATTIEIPAHLTAIYELLDDEPKDLDFLVTASSLGAGEILAQLTELEIYGLVSQMGGRYARV